jgi:predicted AlkP superfamily phosphohydrolase/phosphomutase
VLGTMVSERLYFWRQEDRGDAPEHGRLTYPEDLYAEIRPLVMSPQEVTYEHSRTFMDVSPEEFESMKRVSVNRKTIGGEFKYLYSMFETERRIALHLVERSRQEGAPADLLVLFRIVDIACHRSLAESELVKDHLGETEEDQRKFGRVVSEAYRRADSALREILDATGEANVVVVSDHGFQPEHLDGVRSYQHRHAPPGIFLAAGPAFRRGTVDGLSIYDVLPILVHLKGFPVAEDLAHSLREDVFTDDFASSHPVVRVASYGARGAVVTAQGSRETDEAMLERLRALGYIQ